MDPQAQFCPNMACPVRGKTGEKNIIIHNWKPERYKCRVCERTFSAEVGTPFHRLHYLPDLVTCVMTLIAPLLAELCSLGKESEEGLQTVGEALRIPREGGETWMEAELYRRQGELLLNGVAGEKQAEASIMRALEIARLQQARSFELHAAISLSRLWRRQGKNNAAQQVLTKVYGWFSEGFNTADLRQARALLRS